MRAREAPKNKNIDPPPCLPSRIQSLFPQWPLLRVLCCNRTSWLYSFYFIIVLCFFNSIFLTLPTVLTYLTCLLPQSSFHLLLPTTPTSPRSFPSDCILFTRFRSYCCPSVTATLQPYGVRRSIVDLKLCFKKFRTTSNFVPKRRQIQRILTKLSRHLFELK